MVNYLFRPGVCCYYKIRRLHGVALKTPDWDHVNTFPFLPTLANLSIMVIPVVDSGVSCIFDVETVGTPP